MYKTTADSILHCTQVVFFVKKSLTLVSQIMNHMIRLYTLLLILFFTSGISYSQNVCGQNRYLTEIFNDVDITTGIYYGSANPYGLLNNQDLYLDIYEGRGDTLQKRPVVIHAFGGAFLIGFRSEPDIPNWGTQYAKRGYAFVSIDYRLGFNVLDQNSAVRAAYRASQDFMAALRFLKDNADTYRLDMDNVVVTGSSAGCFAALIIAFMEEADRPQATFGTFLEPSDLGCFTCSGNSNNNRQPVPIRAVVNNWGAMLDTSFIDVAANPADNVPVISFHGTNDLIVPYSSGNPFNLPVFPSVHGSELIHRRLDNQGIYNQLYPLYGLDHEPELIHRWVTDTIVGEASRFLYELFKPNTSNISGPVNACVGDTVTYFVNFRAGSEYCWEVNGGTIVENNGNRVRILLTNLGQVDINVTEYNYIHARTTRNLSVTTGLPPNSAFTFTSNDGLFQFTNTENPAFSYSWNFGDGRTSFVQNPSHQYTDTGAFTVSLTVNTGICSKTFTTTVVSDICPVAAFTTSPANGNAIVNNQSQFFNQLHWDFGDGTTSNDINGQPNYQNDGTYTIRLIASNNFCSDTTFRNVYVITCPEADFDFAANGLDVQFTNTSLYSFLTYWVINGVNYGIENPRVVFDEPGTYEINLLVYNQNGCSDEITRTITVSESTVNTIRNINDLSGISVFPSPASDFLTIQTHNSSIVISGAEIFNTAGIKQMEINTGFEKIDVSKLPGGVYVMNIIINGQPHFHKFIKH
jgi:PKD repeat protein/acetyl esterase/lipase